MNNYYVIFTVSSGKKHPWTKTEISHLLSGVEKFGHGQWASILRSYDFGPYRDNVSLKDKWRNLVKKGQVPKKYL